MHSRQPITIIAIMSGLFSPMSLARLNPINTSMLPITIVTSDGTSIFSTLEGFSFGKTRIPKTAATMESGTLNQNSHRQLNTIRSKPAITGPIAGPRDKLIF